MFVRIIFAVFASLRTVITFGFFYGMHTLIQLQLRDVKEPQANRTSFAVGTRFRYKARVVDGFHERHANG